ncbi:MAG TPA: hypothetical protein VLL95_01420 [Phnomibacter sp.]|nr:hypothetical protein [Phnomibacter sp.]
MSPFPGAFTHLGGKMLKIYRSKKETATHALQPGSFETDGKSYLRFATADGFVYALEVQMEGKKRMQVEDFLRGFRIENVGGA